MIEKNCTVCHWFEKYTNFQDGTKECPGMCVNIKQKDHFLNDVNEEISCSGYTDIVENNDNEIQNNTDYEYPELVEEHEEIEEKEIVEKNEDYKTFF